MNILTAKKLKWLKKGTVQEKLSKYFPMFTICGTFRTKNPLAKHDHCIYYEQFLWSVPCIYLHFPGDKRGNLQMHATCMFKCCMSILAVLKGFKDVYLNFSTVVFWNAFIWKLFCMDLFILHGCLHFFIWTLFSKLIKGSPTSFLFWATSMLSHLLPDTPSPTIFWKN